MYIPRTEPVVIDLVVGGEQTDYARAMLVIGLPDGTAHRVEVTLYASAMDDGHLVLDVDTLGTARAVRVVVNDFEGDAITVEES